MRGWRPPRRRVHRAARARPPSARAARLPRTAIRRRERSAWPPRSRRVRDHHARCFATASAPPCMRQRHVSSKPSCSTRPAPSRRAAAVTRAPRIESAHRIGAKIQQRIDGHRAHRFRDVERPRDGEPPVSRARRRDRPNGGALAASTRAARARRPSRTKRAIDGTGRPERRVEGDDRGEVARVDRSGGALRHVGAGRDGQSRVHAPSLLLERGDGELRLPSRAPDHEHGVRSARPPEPRRGVATAPERAREHAGERVKVDRRAAHGARARRESSAARLSPSVTAAFDATAIRTGSPGSRIRLATPREPDSPAMALTASRRARSRSRACRRAPPPRARRGPRAPAARR